MVSARTTLTRTIAATVLSLGLVAGSGAVAGAAPTPSAGAVAVPLEASTADMHPDAAGGKPWHYWANYYLLTACYQAGLKLRSAGTVSAFSCRIDSSIWLPWSTYDLYVQY